MRQIRIIDAHTHFFCPEAAKDSSAWALARGEAYWAKLVGPRPDGKPTLQGFPDEKKFLSDMDEAGVERAVIQGWYWQNQQTCLEENARISKLVKAHPDRLSAFAAVNPACDGALEIAKSARSMGFCGLGEIHDGVQKFKYSSKAFEKLFNAGFNTSKKIATLDIKEVRKIPNLTMSDFYIISDLWELVKKNNNKTSQLFIEFLSGYKEKGNDSK